VLIEDAVDERTGLLFSPLIAATRAMSIVVGLLCSSVSGESGLESDMAGTQKIEEGRSCHAEANILEDVPN
jgi:hypothetical protein